MEIKIKIELRLHQILILAVKCFLKSRSILIGQIEMISPEDPQALPSKHLANIRWSLCCTNY
jgi:hypothetical protein